MPNYRPIATAVPTAQNVSGIAVLKNVKTSTWGMALLEGTAMSPSVTGHSASPMASGAVDVWESSHLTTSSPQHTTFTDDLGQYGVTVKANVKLVIKFYGK